MVLGVIIDNEEHVPSGPRSTCKSVKVCVPTKLLLLIDSQLNNDVFNIAADKQNELFEKLQPLLDGIIRALGNAILRGSGSEWKHAGGDDGDLCMRSGKPPSVSDVSFTMTRGLDRFDVRDCFNVVFVGTNESGKLVCKAAHTTLN